MSTSSNMIEDIKKRLGYAQEYNIQSKKLGKIFILDSTLREGEQSPGVTFTHRQRLQIAWMLDYFSVDAIEISPIVSPDHELSCKEMIKAGLAAKIVSHIRALPNDIDVALKCDSEWIAMYHSVSDIHLKYKLRVSREQAIERSVEAVEYAHKHGLKMRFTLEDASRADPEFLKEMCREISSAGADRIGIPDTVGAMNPHGMFNLIKTVKEDISTPLDLHCHNDLGLALANTFAGVEAGATQVHTTINGIGERVGLVSLAEVVIGLTLLYHVNLDVRLNMLSELSQLIDSYTGIKTHPAEPLVGYNAYKHKAGTHVAAIIRNPIAYELIPPKLVGNRRRIIIGGLSGRSESAFLLKILGLNPNESTASSVAKGLKRLKSGDLFEIELSDNMENQILEVEKNLNRKNPEGGEKN